MYQIYSSRNQIICALAWNSVLRWWRWDMSKTTEELEFNSQFLLSTLSIWLWDCLVLYSLGTKSLFLSHKFTQYEDDEADN